MSKTRKILVPIILVLGVIQFIPNQRKTVETIPEMVFKTDNIDVNNILNKACMDCHSNQTEYPWYANVVPVNYIINNHIAEGREHVNFSEWNALSQKDREHAIKEIVEVVEAKEMPMLPYWLVHWEAKLTDAERATLVEYFKSL